MRLNRWTCSRSSTQTSPSHPKNGVDKSNQYTETDPTGPIRNCVRSGLGFSNNQSPIHMQAHELTRQHTRLFGTDSGPYEYGVVHQPKKQERPTGRRTVETPDNSRDHTVNSYRKPEYDTALKRTERFIESYKAPDPKGVSPSRDMKGNSADLVNTWDPGLQPDNSNKHMRARHQIHLPNPPLPTIDSSNSHNSPSSGNVDGVSQSSLRRVSNGGDDLERILAKYGKLVRNSSTKSETSQEASGLVRTNTTTLRITTDSGYSQVMATGMAQWEGHSVRQGKVGDADFHKHTGNPSIDNLLSLQSEAVSLGRTATIASTTPSISPSMDSPRENTHVSNPAEVLQLRRSTHAFPFKETANGLLVVDPIQIAFESRKISVLLAETSLDHNHNPATQKSGNQNLSQSLTNSFSSSKNERLLYEIRKAMCLPSDDIQEKTMFLKAPCPQSSREIAQRKYSESRKATAYFEEKILNRIVNAKNADTHVVIGDKVFPCHSIALEAFSAYFEKRTRPPIAIQRIDLSEAEVGSAIFPVIMDWVVQSEIGRAEIISKENLVALYAASKHLEIRDLQEQCLSFLERNIEINDPDLMMMWDVVKRRHPSLSELVRIIAQKLAANFHEIYKSKGFLKMEVEELYMLLNSDDVSISSEMDVYDSAMTWLLHDWKARKVYTNKIMSTVRFGLLSPLQLTQINLCPELSKIKTEHDIPSSQMKDYGSVKSMIDDGLAFSILDESYKNQPEELRKWMTKTGVKAPAHRSCLTNRKRYQPKPYIQEKISLLEDASQTKMTGSSYDRMFDNPSSMMDGDVDSGYEFGEEVSHIKYRPSNFTMGSDPGGNSATSFRELRARPAKPPSSAGSSVGGNFHPVQDFPKPQLVSTNSGTMAPMSDAEQNELDNDQQDQSHYESYS